MIRTAELRRIDVSPDGAKALDRVAVRERPSPAGAAAAVIDIDPIRATALEIDPMVPTCWSKDRVYDAQRLSAVVERLGWACAITRYPEVARLLERLGLLARTRTGTSQPAEVTA